MTSNQVIHFIRELFNILRENFWFLITIMTVLNLWFSRKRILQIIIAILGLLTLKNIIKKGEDLLDEKSKSKKVKEISTEDNNSRK